MTKLNQTFRRGLLTLLTALTILSAGAVPAKPGLTRKINLVNGTTVTAQLVGDEHGHYWLGEDGNAYIGNDNGTYREADIADITAKAAARRSQSNARRTRLMAPRKVGEWGNYTGKKKGIIILVEFMGTTFKTADSNALYQRIANEENFSYNKFKGSMRDYFFKQSEGKFELQFDVVGPVQVSQAYSYYGGNDSQGYDKYPEKMIVEALELADKYVNFADYDWDGDGEVEQVYVVYAGKGEADGGASNTIWPHEWTLNEAGAGAQTLDKVTINTYACGSELNGITGDVAGIGTMCHEFSHCLGYPDFYDTDYSGGQGMGYWDLMDSGSYNDDGYQPAGFTSYERWVAGWSEPIELLNTKSVTGMKSLQDGGESYIIYNKGNKNEYYLLENRQLTGWDASLPGNGLLILHVDYSQSSWNANTPNDTPSHQRMTWVAADNKYQYETYQGSKYYTFEGMANDPFPYGSVNAFNKSTSPAAKFFNKNSDGTYYLDSSVENITQNSDGTISFNFIGLSKVAKPTFSPASGTYTEAQTVSISCTTEGAVIYYTTDGTTPTATSAVYSSPLTVSETTTINAIAIVNDEESVVATATYTIRTGTTGDSKTFRRATSTDELYDGLRCIIARGDQKVAAGSVSTSGFFYTNSYLNSIGVDVEDDIITIDDSNDNVAVFTLEGSGTSYALANSDGNYLYAESAKYVNYTADKKSWTLDVVDGQGVTLTFDSYGTILYNVNNPRFTTYTSSVNTSMLYAQLYIECDNTPIPTKQDATLSFDANTATGTIGKTFTAPSLTTDPADITVAFTSSNPDVATVDAETGEVTLVAAGTTVITASFAGNDLYNAAEATYTLTVEEAASGTTVKYVLVENADNLEAGEEYIVVGSNEDTYYALGTYQKTNNREAVAVTMNADGTITGNDEVQDITLEANGTNWLLNVGTGYLYAASNTKNYLKTEEEYDNNAIASITINDNGTAGIQFQGKNKRNLMRFNYNLGTPLFSCYASGQSDVMLYHKVVEEEQQLLKGDANGDGIVTVVDVMLTVSYILNGNAEAFFFDNADIDENGIITITDVMSIVNIVFSRETN